MDKKMKFHLPSFTDHAKLNLVLLNMLKNMPEYFHDNLEIASIYGVFPPSLWNGGRSLGSVCNEEYIKQVLNAFNSQGIPLRFTFTNPVLEKEHLNDPFCNMVMRLANNGLNEVVVVSPILEEYIRDKYPKYKITSSTCKRITEPEKLSEELEKDYKIVVLDYDLNNKFEILEKISHKEKIELLVNSCCMPGCKNRYFEYQKIGEQMIAYNKHLQKYPNKPFRMEDYSDWTLTKNLNCPSSSSNSVFDAKKKSHHISPELIVSKYMPMGFNQFKIEGRTANRLFLIENYAYYLFKPEARDEARFIFLHNLQRNGIIKID